MHSFLLLTVQIHTGAHGCTLIVMLTHIHAHTCTPPHVYTCTHRLTFSLTFSLSLSLFLPLCLSLSLSFSLYLTVHTLTQTICLLALLWEKAIPSDRLPLLTEVAHGKLWCASYFPTQYILVCFMLSNPVHCGVLHAFQPSTLWCASCFPTQYIVVCFMLSNPVHCGVLHHHAFQPSAIHQGPSVAGCGSPVWTPTLSPAPGSWSSLWTPP